jgi:ribosomal protein S12 methylthiotransferase
MKLSVGIISLGCAKNTVDSQHMAGQLLSSGFTLAPAPEIADIILINTCAFIASAREEAITAIREACRLKQTGTCRAVIVAGCLPQREGKKLLTELPEVSAFLGVDELNSVSDVIRRSIENKPASVEVSPVSSKLFPPTRHTPVFTNGAYAYLKISEGCNHPCAFCTIPSIRGRYRSQPESVLLTEAQRLLNAGFRELTLVAQDTTGYGTDLKNGLNLAKLIRRLNSVSEHDYWVRFMYGFPGRITDELLDAVAGLNHVCHYFDIPVQHSHPDMLRAMNRADTVKAVESLPAGIRARIPDATLRTTCLVGFPGETETHFSHLLDYVRSSGFDHLGVFAYSPEQGTPAAQMTNQVPEALAAERRSRLLECQDSIASTMSSARKGQTVTVLLEKPVNPGLWRGRMQSQAPEVDGMTRVRIRGKGKTPQKLQVGDFVSATITGMKDGDITAEL